MTPWRVAFLRWQTVDGITIPGRVSIAWDNQKGPWPYWDFTSVAWNVDIFSVLPTPSSIPTATR